MKEFVVTRENVERLQKQETRKQKAMATENAKLAGAANQSRRHSTVSVFADPDQATKEVKGESPVLRNIKINRRRQISNNVSTCDFTGSLQDSVSTVSTSVSETVQQQSTLGSARPTRTLMRRNSAL